MTSSEDVQQRQRRAGLIESQFRDVNEVIEDQQEGAAFAEYACECAQKTCEQQLPLSVEEYEEVRRVPTHFIVAPGHVLGDAERVVRETDRYHVVEKIGLAREIAVHLDPRGRGKH